MARRPSPWYAGRERHPLRVIVCDDEPIIREGVAQILRDTGFDVVATAADASELVRKARAHRPDVVITDLRMPPDNGDDGLEAAKTIRRELSGTGVLVLSHFIETQYALDLVGDRAEGVGYLLKHHVGDVPSFVDAVRRVAAGGTVLDPEVVARLVGRRRRRSPIDSLTPRDREVLALMAEGRSNRGIADALVVTVPAVERHVTSIFAKLGLPAGAESHRRVLAVLQYLRR
jgi:DNA-binding NarL/FixJ family response regulator